MIEAFLKFLTVIVANIVDFNNFAGAEPQITIQVAQGLFVRICKGELKIAVYHTIFATSAETPGLNRWNPRVPGNHG